MILALVIGGCSNADGNTSEKTGIIGAMEEEVNSLKETLADSKTTTIAGMEFCEGKLDGVDVVIVRAISDKADDSEEMNYELFKKAAAEHCASVVRYMITHNQAPCGKRQPDGAAERLSEMAVSFH